MQFKALIAAAFVTLVAAEDINTLLGEFPTCSSSCMLTAISATNCALTDYVCQCKASAAITAASTPCLIKVCNTDELQSKSPASLGVYNEEMRIVTDSGSAKPNRDG